MLDGLAFLPTQLGNEGMAHLRTLAPEALMPVVDYFDATYVTGTYRTVMSEGKVRFRAVPPRFLELRIPTVGWSQSPVVVESGRVRPEGQRHGRGRCPQAPIWTVCNQEAQEGHHRSPMPPQQAVREARKQASTSTRIPGFHRKLCAFSLRCWVP